MPKGNSDVAVAMPHYSAALDDDPKVLVATGSRILYSVHIHNNTGAAAFVQVHNKAAITDVTLNTTVPTMSFGVAASSIADYNFPHGVLFNLGVVIASTTTAGGATGASTNVNITYA